MTNAQLKRVEAATVDLLLKGGRGVLVPGGFILTAAHCVDCHCRGGLTLGDRNQLNIRTADRSELTVAVLAVEPVSDIALLGAADSQQFEEYDYSFEDWCERVRPVPIAEAFKVFPRKLSASVFNLNRKWVEAKAFVFDEKQSRITIEASALIKGGASGGPIVDTKGQLLAVVSRSDDHKTPSGTAPRPFHALPAWAVDAIKLAEN